MAEGYRWTPIHAPAEPEKLAVPELRAFEHLWKRERESLQDQDAVAAFTERMNRWWAIETGVIERLYDISEGITLQLVQQGFVASLIPHGEASIPAEELVEILRDQRDSLDLVMDVVGGTRELTVGWIKEIHALLTRHQDTTQALDTLGHWITIPLRRGEWKQQPNNPLTQDGTIHEYCPPEHVAAEMDRLISIYDELPDTPEVRAAWLHHAFTQIHPFQDGNGRVARALASIDFIRSGLFPLLVRRTERRRYLAALRTADSGDLRLLVEYFSDAQEHLLRRAISEAEGAVDAAAGLLNVLDAAAERRLRRQEISASERTLLSSRMSQLLSEAEKVLQETATQVRDRVEGIHVPEVQRARPEQRRWFREQLMRLGDQHGYWVDLNESRDWVRLQLRNGGVTDVVVACHFIGEPSPGAGVAVVFVEHREVDEKTGTNLPMSAAVEPLLLAADEDEASQRHRFLDWLEDSRNAALAQWTRFL